MMHKGFSLVELMMVVAVLAILAAIGGPALSEMVAGQRVKDAAFDLQATLMLMRSESAKRNASLQIEPVAGGWGNGWNVADPKYPGSFISQRGAFSPTVTVTPIFCGATAIRFTNVGRLDTVANAKTPRFDISSSGATLRRCVQVELNGRPVTSLAACSTSCT